MSTWLWPTAWQWPTAPSAWPVSDGSQFWTDWLWRGGYRLQAHATNDSWRVVCPEGIRRGYGSREHCSAIFDRLAGDPPDSLADSHIVILLHGLLRTRRCMKSLEQAVREAGITTVIRFDYASSRLGISTHAAALRSVVEGLPPTAPLSFVGHSMGNIVLRHAIGDWLVADPQAVLSRMHRVVMLGPPNHGAAIARVLSQLKLFGVVTGEGGKQLGPNWNELHPKLGLPPCPFAIVAGDLAPRMIRNPLIGPHSDLLVTVDEAKLEGAAELLVIPVPHSRLMTDARVLRFATDFITAEPSANPPAERLSTEPGLPDAPNEEIDP